MLKKRNKISEAVVRRLPKYYACMKELEEKGINRVSSNVIAETLNITASQVRQDFSNFGEFGQQGYGYEVEFLKDKIREILGLKQIYNIVIIGGGHIGQALANYKGFQKEGFNVLAVFDVIDIDAKLPSNVPLLNMSQLDNFVKENEVNIAVITTQSRHAKEAAEACKNAGIVSIWNFAPVNIDIEGVTVENINMSESLFTLAYKIHNRENI